MSGLECVEILFSNLKIDNEKYRFDSEFFLKIYLSAYNKLKKINHSIIGNEYDCLSDFHSNGSYKQIAENFTLLDKKNYAYMVRTVDLEQDDFTENVKYISKHSYEYLSKSKIYGGELLINKIGSPGRTYLMPNLNIPVSLGMNLFMLRMKKDSIFKESFLWIFFNTEIGKNIIKRKINGTVPMTIDKIAIKSLYIPIFSKNFYDKIDFIVNLIARIKNNYREVYKQAEKLLIDELNIKIIDNNNVNTKFFNNSFGNSGRLHAEYYLPKYEDLQKNIYKYPKKGNICSIITLRDKNITPKDNKKYKYIELANIDNIGNVIDCTEDFGANLPTRARRIVHTGDVIISSIEGSLNKCAVITEEFDGAFCSTGFFVIKSGIFTAETLLVLFKSEVLQNLMKKGCSGTILTAISKEEFEKICIPILNDNIQQKITCYIKQSKLLYNQSKLLLEVAKKSVEIAIEQNEDSALKYLEEKSNEILNLNKEVI